jgi:hypothetical protein
MKWDWKQMGHQLPLYTDYINKWAKHKNLGEKIINLTGHITLV